MTYHANLCCAPDQTNDWRALKNLLDAQFAGSFEQTSHGVWGTLRYSYPGFLQGDFVGILENMLKNSDTFKGAQSLTFFVVGEAIGDQLNLRWDGKKLFVRQMVEGPAK